MNFRHGPGNIQGAPAQHRVYKEKLESWSQKIVWWGGSLPLVGEAEGEWPEVSRDQQLGRGSAHGNTNRLFE